MLLPNTILQGRYRIIRLLGKGGMGAVYEAIDQRVSCVVALKETLVGAAPEARRAFEREAALLANLRHRSLPKVMDNFSEGDGHFLVMEYIPGHDLAELLKLRGSRFELTQVLRWADQLLGVLAHLHTRQPPILHRDIKPSNLKVTTEDEVFLLDFGLAKGATGQMSTLITDKSIRGFTPSFASLEQILDRGTDPRSDLYSLAATLYLLLTNTEPTDAATRFAAVEDDKEDPLSSIEAFNPQVSSRIAAVIHQAMSMNRRQRPSSAADMQKYLRIAAAEDEGRVVKEDDGRAELPRLLRDGEKRRKGEQDRETDAEARKRSGELHPTGRADLAMQQEEEAASGFDERQRAIEIERRGAKIATAIPASGSVWAGTFDDPFATNERTPQFAQNKFEDGVVLAMVSFSIAALMGLFMLYSSAAQSLPVIEKQVPATVEVTNGTDNRTALPLPPKGMVYVPGGTFMMGRNKADGGDDYESPAHQQTVRSFVIDAYEVTNEDYAKFVDATNHNPPGTWGGTYPTGAARHPVTGVTWNDANDYARWVGKRLPTEEEWEFAARGTDGRRYPWGDEWQDGLANANGPLLGITKVGSYEGKSPFGAFDMVGNAWEWTASDMRAYPGGTLPERSLGETKVLRGGSYQSPKMVATTTYRYGWRARGESTYSSTGFRCAKDFTDTSVAPKE